MSCHHVDKGLQGKQQSRQCASKASNKLQEANKCYVNHLPDPVCLLLLDVLATSCCQVATNKAKSGQMYLPRARGATTSFRRQTTLLMHVPHVFMFSPMLPFMCIRCFFTYTDTAFSCPVIGKSVTDSLLRALGQQFRVLERGIHLTNCFLYTSLQNSAEAKLLREPLMGSKEFPIKRF